jgi:putative addiction module component (TIGR02574 family)
MPMTVEQIEAEVLKLPEQAQVELLGRLMRSLADTAVIEPDVAEAWVQEAIRRDEEMESGSVAGIPAEEVFAALRSKGK